MLKRPTVLAVLAALATAIAFAIAVVPSAHAAVPLRIMPLGDSITGSPGCWRALLWNRLQSTGYTNIDMVGTLGPQGCGVPYDGDNEGHGGALVTSVADQNQLVGWLATARPDIVVMHFGTNDVWSNRSTAQILAAYGKLVDQMRASNATMRILVAQIIPVAPSSCGECPARTVALNDAIPGWAASKTTAQSPITVVNQWAGWVPSTHTTDGVHPNGAGDQRMSDTWYPALAAAIAGTTPPTTTPPTTVPPTTVPPTTVPPTTTPPTTPPDITPPTTPGQPVASNVTSSSVTLAWAASTDNVGVVGYDVFRAPGASGGSFAQIGTSTSASFTNTGLAAGTTYRYQVRARDAAGALSGFSPAATVTTTGGGTGGCTAAYSQVGSNWPGGFQGQVTVTNAGTTPTTAWSVTLTFPSGQRITQLWGARTTSTASPYLVTNESYNGTIGANGTVTFGFLGSWTGTNPAPSATCTRTP